MSYLAVVATPVEVVISGRRHLIITITETGITLSTDEWTATGLPKCGVVTEVDSVLSKDTGTVTTIDPRVSEISGGFDLFDNGTPTATTVHARDTTRRPYTSSSGTLYGGARANGTLTGTSNVVTRITILAGHQ